MRLGALLLLQLGTMRREFVVSIIESGVHGGDLPGGKKMIFSMVSAVINSYSKSNRKLTFENFHLAANAGRRTVASVFYLLQPSKHPQRGSEC